MATSIPAARLHQLTKDIVRIEVQKGFDVTIMVGSEAVQAIVSDGEETFIIRLEPPKPGQTVAVARNNDGTTDVVYRTA